MRMLLTGLLALLLLGSCGEEAPLAKVAPTPLPAAPAAEVATPESVVVTKDSATPETITTTKGLPVYDSYGYWGPASLAEMIAWSDIVVLATFVSARPVGVRSARPDSPYYVGALEVTFNAREYLKGVNQGPTITGVMIGTDTSEGEHPYTASTEAEAAVIAEQLLDWRDKRWDDRQAIIMLTEVVEHGYLLLGHLGPGAFKTTVADLEDRSWLPDASPDTDARSPAQFFLTDEPKGKTVAGRTPGQETPAQPNVSLATLRDLIAENARMLAAGDGSREYSECLAMTLTRNRMSGAEDALASGSISSGQPARTKAVAYQPLIDVNLQLHGPDEPDDYPSHLAWYEGPAGHLLEFQYPGYAATKRPLPAGEYRAIGMARRAEMVVCDGKPDAKVIVVITVTAPAGTLAESFFDPATSSAAVVGTTTVGAISWEASRVTADLTLTVPTAATLDFIALDGTVALSLAVANATSTDGVLAWEVTPQPWDGDDQLMLRIRNPAPP